MAFDNSHLFTKKLTIELIAKAITIVNIAVTAVGALPTDLLAIINASKMLTTDIILSAYAILSTTSVAVSFLIFLILFMLFMLFMLIPPNYVNIFCYCFPFHINDIYTKYSNNRN